MKTLKMEPLRKHIAYTLYSGFVENKPRDISTLIIAYPERAKSTEAKRFRAIGAAEVQDLSSWGILICLNGCLGASVMVEYFYAVDEKDNVIGKATREDCHRSNRIIHRLGYIFVLNDKDELFLQKRSESKDLYGGYYS